VFEFSPSVQLVLTNLPTIRQILKLLDEGTIKEDVERFLKHMEMRLREDVPEVNTWESEISDQSLYLYPGKGWRVVKGDHIAICVYMEQCVEPCFYDNEDDPMVALYVPDWKDRPKFTAGLGRLRIPGFEHISSREDIETEYYPLWSTVHVAPLVKESTLDVDGLEKAIVDRARKLVAKEGAITNLISKLREKAV
jgi:hypothetical protein